MIAAERYPRDVKCSAVKDSNDPSKLASIVAALLCERFIFVTRCGHTEQSVEIWGARDASNNRTLCSFVSLELPSARKFALSMLTMQEDVSPGMIIDMARGAESRGGA